MRRELRTLRALMRSARRSRDNLDAGVHPAPRDPLYCWAVVDSTSPHAHDVRSLLHVSSTRPRLAGAALEPTPARDGASSPSCHSRS
jgi:hypothetical protein